MNKQIILVCILAIFVSQIVTQDAVTFAKYQDYINKFGKQFSSLDDLTKHYQSYEANMQHVAKLNSQNPQEEGDNTVFGENEFSDMDPEEFQKKYLTFSIPEGHVQKNGDDTPTETTETDTGNLQGRNLQSIPSYFDWRSYGVVGVVKNQGSCGCCWAFASVANIEGLYARKYGVLKNFSEQQLLDCTNTNYGCNGGMMENAFSYVRSAGGLEETYAYGSYRQYQKTCSFNRNYGVARVSSWVFPGSNEVSIRNYLYNNGPITAGVNADNLQYYSGGILNVYCSTAVNHAVTLVGYGTSNGLDYWIVKNSWGSQWGESGFFRIRRGVGMCGINTYVVSAVLA